MKQIIFRRSALLAGFLVLLLPLLSTGGAAAEPETAGGWELRICADPQGLPFSDRDTPGFENRIAALLAEELGAELTHEWTRFNEDLFNRHFGEGTCDVIMGVPDGMSGTLGTITYYQSPYVMVYRRDAPFGEITDMDDPVLAGLALGVQGHGIPPHEALRQRGLGRQVARIFGGEEGPDRLGRMVQAVAEGEIDVGFGWGPVIGYWAAQNEADLVVVPVEPAIDLPAIFQFQSMTMAVRQHDVALQERLNRALSARWEDIRQVLADYSVPVLPAPPPGAPSAAPSRSLRIGVVIPMPTAARTNVARVYDLAGNAARQGALFAEAASSRGEDSVDVKLLLANSPSADAARRAADGLLALGEVDALVGGIGTDQAEQLAEAAAAYGVPFLNIGSTSLSLRERCLPVMFSVQPSAATYVRAMATLYGADGASSSWFAIHGEGAEGEKLLAELTDVLRETGDTLAGSAVAENNRPVYYDLLDEAVSAGADTVALFLSPADELTLIGQAEDAGYDLTFAPFPDPLTQTREFLASGKRYDVGLDIPRIQLWEPTLDSPAAADLNGKYAGQWGQPFDAPAWAAFEAVTVLAEAVREAGASDAETLLGALPAVDAGAAGAKESGQHFSPDNHELTQELYSVGINPEGGWGLRLSRQLEAGTLLDVLAAPASGGSTSCDF